MPSEQQHSPSLHQAKKKDETVPEVKDKSRRHSDSANKKRKSEDVSRRSQRVSKTSCEIPPTTTTANTTRKSEDSLVGTKATGTLERTKLPVGSRKEKNGTRPSRLTKYETSHSSPLSKKQDSRNLPIAETPPISNSIGSCPTAKSVISEINSLSTSVGFPAELSSPFTIEGELFAASSPTLPHLLSNAATSLLSTMSTEDIQLHIASLQNWGIGDDSDNAEKLFALTGRRLVMKCLPIVINLIYHTEHGWIFKKPVDPKENCAPDYFDVIQNPMDLGLIRRRLESGFYQNLYSFESDVHLVFDNCILYNGEDSDLGGIAINLKNRFLLDLQTMLQGLNSDGKHNYHRGKICALCSKSNRKFEPTIIYCRGSCAGKRIQPNSSHFTYTGRQNHYWCSSCYGKLRGPIVLDDGAIIHKKNLLMVKNSSVAEEEEWIECSRCKNHIHQICGLTDCNKDSNTSTAFLCPRCVIRERRKDKGHKSNISTRSQVLNDLPHCIMSESIESGLRRALQSLYEEKANELGIPLDQVEKANTLYVRVVHNSEQKHAVRDEMLERYRDRGYPQEFNVRTKCILLFQTIHGVDVLLFGMYVYEYDQNCPPPNQRRVYISYLDSVNFFQPSEYRTFTYHTILIEYLRYVKSRGFHTAHIWACPAWDGDDFIFHIHPPHQKNTREDILCSWYQTMLATAEAEGVAIQIRTLYDEYFKTDKDKICLDPTCIPYFDSDYIPGEIESIIKDLKKQDQGKQKEKCGKSIVTKSKEKLGGKKKRSTRSNPNLIVHLEPDIVMKRLGHTLSQIKRNFFVVYLRSRAFAEAANKGEDVSMWTELDDEKHKVGDFEECYDRCGNNCTENLLTTVDVIGYANEANGDNPIGTISQSNFPVSCNEKLSDVPAFTKNKIMSTDLIDIKCSPEASSMLVEEDKEVDDADNQGKNVNFGNAIERHSPPTHEKFKSNNEKSHSSQVVQTVIGSTIDVDPMINSEIFETRQQFLHFCRTNHYQFDELRRAKHSSMMVLYRIRNELLASQLLTSKCGMCNKLIIDGGNMCFNQSEEGRKQNVKQLLEHINNCEAAIDCPNLNSYILSILSIHHERGANKGNFNSNGKPERRYLLYRRQQREMEERRRNALNNNLYHYPKVPF